MRGKYTIVDLNEHHMPDVLRICRQELGPDYHSEADFKKCLGSSREYFCKVILDDEGADVICSMASKSIHGVTNAGKMLVENGLETLTLTIFKGFEMLDFARSRDMSCTTRAMV